MEKVIHLLDAENNLISTSQYSRDRKDRCRKLSRGEFLDFMWDDDSKKEFIQYDPTYIIPLILVNKSDDDYM